MSKLAWLRNTIDASPNAAVSFYEYMHLCLYSPEHGYYMKESPKIGKDGDFYTSSNVGTVMGEILARFISRTARDAVAEGERVMLAEWGGGNGKLARQVLDELVKLDPELYDGMLYLSMEVSPYHRRQQEQTLGDHRGKLIFEPPADASEAVWIGWANELIDAFPCRRFRRTLEGLEEMFVEWDESADIPKARWEAVADPGEELRRIGSKLAVGQQFERQPDIEHWFAQASALAQRMTLAVIDYGDVEEELLGDHRMNGTFLCYRNHEAKDAPFESPGEQDMTVHANFSQCERAARSAGFTKTHLTTQKQFLVDHGLLELLQDHALTDPFHPIARRNRAIRQLLISDQMSELFKVLTVSK